MLLLQVRVIQLVTKKAINVNDKDSWMNDMAEEIVEALSKNSI